MNINQKEIILGNQVLWLQLEEEKIVLIDVKVLLSEVKIIFIINNIIILNFFLL